MGPRFVAVYLRLRLYHLLHHDILESLRDILLGKYVTRSLISIFHANLPTIR